MSRIVATSHFYPHKDSVRHFIARRDSSYMRLTSAMRELESAPEIRLGAEVLICDNIEILPDIEKLCIYGTKALLLELPFQDFEKKYIDSFAALIDQGFKTVIAHADRYSPAHIEKLLSVGAQIQLNTCSLNTLFKDKILYNWIERGRVVALGSDIHGDDKRAYRDFSRAIAKLGSAVEGIKAASDEIWSESKPLNLE